MIPVNLRDLNKPITELGNQFSLVYLRLPLETAGALERLSIVKQQMDVLKQSPEPLIVYGILSILGMAPGPVSNAAADWFSNKASAVLTNVPGPREPIFFAGLPLKRILFWVPSTGRIGLGISIISYNGEVTLGISVDEGLIAEPAQITARFREEIELLRDAIEAAGPRAARNGAAPLAGTPAATPVATAKDPVVEMAEEWPHGANPPHPLHGGLSVEEAPVEEPEEGRSARPASD
jgi:hypothetical protein